MNKVNISKIIAAYPICNNASLNIYMIDEYGEYIYAGINKDKPHKYKLYYNNSYYFNYKRTRYYLNEFMVVNL